MPNQRKPQASACWLVELGNGDKFLFDLGTGPVSFSLEWKNRKFVFSSDTFPNKWFIQYAKNADIVIHETFGTIRQNIDLQGWNRANSALVSSRVYTPPAAAGKVFSIVKPRMAIAYHFFNDTDEEIKVRDVIKAYYERQGVGDLYEEQIPKK